MYEISEITKEVSAVAKEASDVAKEVSDVAKEVSDVAKEASGTSEPWSIGDKKFGNFTLKQIIGAARIRAASGQ